MKKNQYIKDQIAKLLLYTYRHLYIPIKSFQIRHKRKIKVLFPIWDLSKWKTENLYLEMQAHPRFEPLIVAYRNNSYKSNDDRIKIYEYCKSKGYNCIKSDVKYVDLFKTFKPDIIFEQSPGTPRHEFRHNLRALFCYVSYCFRQTLEEWSYKRPYLANCWQIYYENKDLCLQYKEISKHDINNFLYTGLPIQDELLKSNFNENPWIKSDKFFERKKIIYAPHHSILNDDPLKIGTFLIFYDNILKLAEKYSDKIQWAFKPHPVLYPKLCKIWGKDATDAYYLKWNNLEWGQVERDRYISLFQYSDAMIHDCASFAVEFLYIDKPVMYLSNENHKLLKLNNLFDKALNTHIFGYDIKDIEHFILSVISGDDTMKEKRKKFKSENLVPPFNRTASQNIIDSILYKKRANEFKIK